MKSNYKPIGDYIRKVENRNTDLKVTKLLGLSMTKEFRETTSNIIGTDMSVYKIMLKNQFACDFMSPIRVSKLPVVLKTDDEPILVSPAYPVFEIEDTKKLLPEYLMMWFRRPEFDRYATFKCDSAIRGGYDWEELCKTLIPVPHPDKQKEIVKEYNSIVNRIALNNQLIQKLEETAQAIYKQWFVEGQDTNEKIKLSELVQTQYGYTETASTEIIGPKFLRITDIAQSHIDWANVPYCRISENDFEKYKLKSGDIVVARTGATAGYAKRLHKYFPECVFASFLVRLIPNDSKWNLFLGLTVDNKTYKDFILSNAEGSAQPQANAPLLTSFEIIKPDESKISEFNRIVEPIFDLTENRQLENQKLSELKDLLLSKLATLE